MKKIVIISEKRGLTSPGSITDLMRKDKGMITSISVKINTKREGNMETTYHQKMQNTEMTAIPGKTEK